MRRILFFLLATSLPCMGFTQDESVRLQYLPATPIIQRSLVEVTIDQKLPGQELTARAHQEAQAEITVNSTGSSESVEKPPFDVTVVFKSLRVGMEIEDRAVDFDTKVNTGSPLLSEVSKVIEQPIRVTVGDNLQIEGNADFQRLVTDLQPLKGFSIGNLFSDILQHLFALAGQDLTLDHTISRSMHLGADPKTPVKVNYTISAITDREVRANIEGSLPLTKITLPNAVLGTVTEGQSAELSVSGQLTGKAVWSRKNALIFKTRLQYTYKGTIKSGDKEWPFELRLNHNDSSTVQ